MPFNYTKISNFVPVVTIRNGNVDTPIEAYRWHCTTPAYGSIGSFRIYASREVLANAGVNLYQIGRSAVTEQLGNESGKGQIGVHIGIRDVDTGAEYKLFGGELDVVRVEYDVDTVIIEGRDWAGLLIDMKGQVQNQTVVQNGGQPLQASTPSPCNDAGSMAPTGTDSVVDGSVVQPVSSLNITGMYPSVMAYNIAVKFGFNPIIYTLPNEPTMGALTAASASSFTEPRPWWDYLLFAARMMGWECYVTPNKDLYFGPYDLSTSINLSWGITPPANTLPARDMHITYNPRRNSSFLVLVGSYHAATASQTTAAVGTLDPATQKAMIEAYPHVDVQLGKYTIGSAGAPSANALAGYFTNLGKPVYFYSYPNLTSNEANAKAYELMLDIAKREVIMTAAVDGTPFLQPMQTVTLTGDTGDFTDTKYYINGIEHTFSIEEGWYTHISARTLPPVTTQQFLQSNSINGVSVTSTAPTLYKPNGQ